MPISQLSPDLTPSQRAQIALDGLSVGDAFGERFFRQMHDDLPPPPWRWTDDTMMAVSIVENLEAHGYIEPDALALAFARRFVEQPHRGYGGGAFQLLQRIYSGMSWREASPALFRGEGSLGNGGAMRAAPIGAWLADSPGRIVEEARKSAMVTHAHPEGQAGAIAVAIAAGWAWRWGQTDADARPPAEAMLASVLDALPDGPTAEGVKRAKGLGLDAHQITAVNALGNGSRITAPDTVPFCLWAAAKHLGHYVKAQWYTMRAGGDIDTNCAIVGGIVALTDPTPQEWLSHREALPLF